MPKPTVSALAQHKIRQAQERLLAGSAWRTPVLTCEGDQVAVDDLVLSRHSVIRLMLHFDSSDSGSVDAGWNRHHRFHDLRHTAVTLLAVQGVHPRAIQAALGWENLSMLNRYAHLWKNSGRPSRALWTRF